MVLLGDDLIGNGLIIYFHIHNLHRIRHFVRIPVESGQHSDEKGQSRMRE